MHSSRGKLLSLSFCSVVVFAMVIGGSNVIVPGMASVANAGPTVSDVSLGREDTDRMTLRIEADTQLGGNESDLSVSIESPTTEDWVTFDRGDFDEANHTGTYSYTLARNQTYSDGDGEYTARVEVAKAPSGPNGATGENDSYVLDTTPPAISAFNVTNPTGQEIIVQFESSEQLALITVAITGAETATLTTSDFNQTGTGPFTYRATYAAASDGSYTARLTAAEDAKGNNGASNESDSLIVDTTAPRIHSFTATNPTGRTITIAFETNEQLGSDPEDIRVAISGTAEAHLSRSEFNETKQDDYRYTANHTVPSDGNYSVILTNASDPAGNDGLTAENVSVEVTVSSEDEEDDEETEDVTSGDSTGSGSGDDAPRENTDDSRDSGSRDSGARDAGENDDSGAPSNGQSSANASVSVRSPSPNQLDVVIERARVNQSVTLEVPSSFGQESMESDLSRIVILPARHTDLTLRLTEMRRPPDGVPHINASRPIEPMVYLTVGHSTSDQVFKRVRFYFVVDKAAGAGMMASPESVEVYRFSTGQWQELPTHLVNETPTSYVYVGESPGFSAFAFGYNTSGSRSPNSTQGLDDGRADIEITDAVVDESEVTQGENITVRATAENKGPATGRIQVTVRANGTTLIRDDRTVPAGTTREFVYHPQLETPGVVEITVNGIPSGAVEVTPSTGPGTTRSGGTTAARSEEASSEPFPTAPWGVGGVDGSGLSHGIIGWGAGIATLIIMFTVGYYGTGVYLRKGR